MANDTRPIGERLKAIDEHAHQGTSPDEQEMMHRESEKARGSSQGAQEKMRGSKRPSRQEPMKPERDR